MNLRDLQCVVVLADELSFSRAAERLHLAQPALSQQVRRIESHLGAQLVDRSHRPLRLTPAGEYFSQHAQQVITAWERAAAGTREIALGRRGWLSIGFTRSSGYSVLPPALKTFHARHPDVELKLFEMVTEDQADALRAGSIHVGLGRQPSPLEGFSTRTVLSERVLVALARDHPAAAHREPSLVDLAASPVVLYPRDPRAQFARSVEDLYRAAGLVPHVEHRTFEIQTAIALVAAGLGVTFVAESVARHGRADVAFRPVREFAEARSTVAVTWPTDGAVVPVTDFLDCLPDEQQGPDQEP
ncbi:LysR family transcriptional regulator [Kineococcus sp. SYSU DK003]|uniref:LysR family transcriptional regulator n=1 Tax=Kineococcus sp. SYSU DK003 TaxID=3383124 RepID=UPI003D7DACCE